MTTKTTTAYSSILVKFLFAGMLPFILLLAGCDLNASVDVTKDGDATAVYSLSMTRDQAKTYMAKEDCQELMSVFRDLDLVDDTAKVDDKSTDSDLVCRYTYQMKDGKDYMWEKQKNKNVLRIKLAPQISENADLLDKMKIVITLPTKVVASDVGQVDGKTVTITQAGDLHNDFTVTCKKSSVATWVAAIVVVVVLIALVLVVIILVSRRRKAKKLAGATSATEQTDNSMYPTDHRQVPTDEAPSEEQPHTTLDQSLSDEQPNTVADEASSDPQRRFPPRSQSRRDQSDQ